MGHAAQEGHKLPITRGIEANASWPLSRNIAEKTWHGWGLSSYASVKSSK